jgi:hypothetical protein
VKYSEAGVLLLALIIRKKWYYHTDGRLKLKAKVVKLVPRPIACFKSHDRPETLTYLRESCPINEKLRARHCTGTLEPRTTNRTST